MEYSPQQSEAIKAIMAWHKEPSSQQVFRLFGFAGTGKTTLAKEVDASINGDVLYAAFTGKASLILRQKDCDGATTIHSLIYKVKQDPETGKRTFSLNHDSDLKRADLLIVDEVSMVGEKLAKDLLSFKTKVLVLGDPAQLPPVKDEGFFINSEPDFMLTEVHRQARDNPIIQMSMDIREGRGLAIGDYGQSSVLKRNSVSEDDIRALVTGADQVICGMNKTRVSYNNRLRQLKGMIGKKEPWHPISGDKLICLKNDHGLGLFNGGMWIADKVKSGFDALNIDVSSLDEERASMTVSVPECFFNGTEKTADWRELRNHQQFTYGWAITCHKSQGSQWDNVVIFDESGAFREAQRNWLYTAVTRAAQKVTVIQ